MAGIDATVSQNEQFLVWKPSTMLIYTIVVRIALVAGVVANTIWCAWLGVTLRRQNIAATDRVPIAQTR